MSLLAQMCVAHHAEICHLNNWVYDLSVRMEWDELKRARNVANHEGLDFADARDRFEWETALIVDAHPGKDGRPRFQAIGFLDSDLVSFVFAALGTEAISAISLRRASRAERKRYANS